MNQYNYLINKNELNINKCTIKGKAIIIYTDTGKYVLKEKNLNKLYNYLRSRKFYNFPKLVDYDRERGIYEYIENIDYDEEEKALDLIKVLSILHNKTTYYKEVTKDEYKSIYESIRKKIDYIYNYYVDIINVIENKVYMSPSEYLLSRNISKVFASIFYAKQNLEEFYEMTKNKKRKRVVTLHNNLDTSNILKNENIYLISWNSCVDMPIYDLINFYNKRCLDFDFLFLFKQYENINILEEYEKTLLLTIISIPDKIIFKELEIENVKNVRMFLDKIYKTESILNFKEKQKTTKTNESEH